LAVDPAAKFFGGQIKWHRERLGYTREHVAGSLGYQPRTIASFEGGVRVLRGTAMTKLDRFLQADGSLVAGAARLTPDAALSFFGEYEELERDAAQIVEFETMTFPGLLQTPDYARSVISARRPTLDEDDIEERVARRLARQALLTRRPYCDLVFILEEWMLRRAHVGQEILKGQLVRLLEVGECRHITVQVLPFDVMDHPGLDGPLTMLVTGDGRHVAYAEGQDGGIAIEDPERVHVLGVRCGIIRSQAKTEAKSRKLIQEIAGSL